MIITCFDFKAPIAIWDFEQKLYTLHHLLAYIPDI